VALGVALPSSERGCAGEAGAEVNAERQQRLAEWAAEKRARAAFDALPTPALVDLKALSDHDLSAITREREVAYQAALGETERRRVEKGAPSWSEETFAAALALKRTGAEMPVRATLGQLPPALFRIGYEWAAITLLDVLSGVLARPSSDIVEICDIEPAGRDLWRIKKGSKPKVFDPRRRAALDLINMLQNYTSNQQQGMFTTYKLRVTYDPAEEVKS
jgi:hypothetical protein